MPTSDMLALATGLIFLAVIVFGGLAIVYFVIRTVFLVVIEWLDERKAMKGYQEQAHWMPRSELYRD